MDNRSSEYIQGVTVNHNTSRYTELLLRSLFARHSSGLDLFVTIMDNRSGDDMTNLRAFAESKGIPIIQSGFSIDTKFNSHGEILTKFVLEHPNCSYYLLLDADVCFLEQNTIDTMVAEVEGQKDVFGIAPRQTWDGEEEIPENMRDRVYFWRLHPCCALIKNSAVFRRIVEEVGMMPITYWWGNEERYLDTCELMTKVMKSHGLRHVLSSKMVYHFFNVAYNPQWMEDKNRRCDALLRQFRDQELTK